MIDAADSPYLDCPLETLAAAVGRRALEPRPDLSDPVLTALGWETAQYMTGACSLLALHLWETRGMAPVILEGRQPGQSWTMSHAAVCACPIEEARWHIAKGMAGLPILDAAGGGGFRMRLPLYRERGRDYRVILAESPQCSVHGFLQPGTRTAGMGIERAVSDLPALAYALGAPFDIKATLSRILAEPLSRQRRGAEMVFASGLPEWVEAPMPKP